MSWTRGGNGGQGPPGPTAPDPQIPPSWLTACADRQLCRPPLGPLSRPGTNSLDRRPTRPPAYTDDTQGEGPTSGACVGSLSLVPAVAPAPNTGRGTQRALREFVLTE